MKKLTFLLSALFLIGSVFGQKAPTTKLISSSEESIVVNVKLNGFSTIKVLTPMGEQCIVDVPKMAANLESGAPELPTLPIPTIIGDHAEMTVSVIDAQYTDYTNYEIAPSKGNLSRQINPDDVPYTYGEMYQQDAFWPATQAYLEKPYILRDFRGQNIMVRPFAYNPVTKTLRVYTEMTIAMTKVSDNGANQKAVRKSNILKVDPEQKAQYRHRFINFGEACSKYTFDEDFGEMLVICADMYMSNLQPFVEWKNQSGRPTTMVSVSTAGGNTPENIKNYVSNFYNDPNHNLEFLLLVGEYNDITPKNLGSGSGGTVYSDPWFGKLEGNDDYLEVFVGRFSVSDAADADLQVNKSIYYERDVLAGASWGNKGMGIGYYGAGSGHFGEDDYQHIDYIRDSLLHYTYAQVTEHHGGSGGDASASTISGTINEGISMINYCNHGSETSWGVAGYSVSNVSALTNDNMLPVVWSVACLNGKFDVGTCFAESWLRAKNNATGAPTGAVAGMFSFVSQPWVPPMYGQDEMVNILTGWRSVDQFNHTIGGASLNGSMYVLDMAPGDSYQTFNSWILFGDPSALIRTDIPTTMNVSADPAALMLGMNELNVNADVDYAIATLSMDGEMLASGRIVNGQCTLSFPPLNNVGMAQLVVLGYNKETFMTEIEVVPAEGPFITVSNYAINADQANYGQVVNMDIDLKNVGVEIANNMTATLTTDCPYIQILSDHASISSLNPDEIVTVEGFQFRVTENVPDETMAQFILTVRDATHEWGGKINIILHAPIAALNLIEDNGQMLKFNFINNGTAPFYGGSLSLYSSSTDLVFTEPQITFDNTVNPNENVTLEMPYTIDENVEIGITFEVAYELVSGLQIVSGDYVIANGVIAEDFETGEFGEGWTFSEQHPWIIVSGGRGAYCAKSDNQGQDNSEGYCELTVDVAAAGDLTFWYKVSSENNYDKLHFYMDGQEKGTWSGSMNGFEQFSQPVTTGTHIFRWSYTKDISVSSGSDCAWIDDIQFPPTDAITFIEPAGHLTANVVGTQVTLSWSGSDDIESYIVKRDNVTVATVTETTYTENVDNGVYKYSVFSQIGGQISKPATVIVHMILMGTDENSEAGFSIYPNPVNNTLYIQASETEYNYVMYNSMGQEVVKGIAQGTHQINVANMAKGIYILRITTGSQVNTQKIVVK